MSGSKNFSNLETLLIPLPIQPEVFGVPLDRGLIREFKPTDKQTVGLME